MTAEPKPQDEVSTRTGMIQGRVVFQGDLIPKPTEIENTTDPEVCGSRQSFYDILISPSNRGIQNVIVALAGGGLENSPAPSVRKVVLDNRNCRFDPHVAVMTAGGTVEALNSDPIFHTTHLYYGALDRNLALSVGETRSQLVSRPGLIVVKCDIHGWMKAFIRVDRHPYHAVTGSQGEFTIQDVPAGSYTLEVWHEVLGEQKMPVTVKTGQTERLEIHYRQ
ncbi:MAG: hypothetical protein HY648_05885 [Acidobacteria bacterium]|nr:hypothetical protein [Acidobacteriota bacterium]